MTVIPVCFAHDGDKIYTAVDQKPKTTKTLARVSNLASNPRVAFIVDKYAEDWRRLSYLLVHGDASLIEGEDEEAETARRLLLQKYPQYHWLELGAAPVVRIRVREAKLWRFQRSDDDDDSSSNGS